MMVVYSVSWWDGDCGKQRSRGMVSDVQVGRTSSAIRLHGFGRDLVSGLTLVKFSS